MEQNILHNDLASMLSNQCFTLTLLPTECCNFRCTYCYEDHKTTKMDVALVQAIKRLIKIRTDEKDFRYLTIGWFGGEPLLAIKIIQDISNYAKTLSQKKFQFNSSITTNGYLLTPVIFKKLLSVNINYYQISLDGPKDIHDKTRIKINGDGTFDHIWSNLLAIREIKGDFTIILRIHITPENLSSIIDFTPLLTAHFGHDKRFSIFFKAIENLGGKEVETFSQMGNRDETIAHLYELLGNNINTKQLDQTSICYAAKPNAIVIRANGDINKCTVSLNDPKNYIGKICKDGTIDFDQEKLQPWLDVLQGFKKEVLACPWREVKESLHPGKSA